MGFVKINFLFRFCVVLCYISMLECKKLPDLFNVCYQNDPQFRNCFANEAKRVIKIVSQGLPELEIPPLDPLDIGDIDVISDGSGNLHLKQINTIMKGLSNAQVLDAFIDLENKTGYSWMTGDSIVESNYELKGRLIVVPINGKGFSTVKINGYDIKQNYDFEYFTKKDGLKYIRVLNSTTKFNYKKVEFEMDGLFSDNSLLGAALNNVLNENADVLMNELGTPVTNIFVAHLIKIINKFFSKIPFDELFPMKE